jgi:hypothetical protein
MLFVPWRSTLCDDWTSRHFNRCESQLSASGTVHPKFERSCFDHVETIGLSDPEFELLSFVNQRNVLVLEFL